MTFPAWDSSGAAKRTLQKKGRPDRTALLHYPEEAYAFSSACSLLKSRLAR